MALAFVSDRPIVMIFRAPRAHHDVRQKGQATKAVATRPIDTHHDANDSALVSRGHCSVGEVANSEPAVVVLLGGNGSHRAAAVLGHDTRKDGEYLWGAVNRRTKSVDFSFDLVWYQVPGGFSPVVVRVVRRETHEHE